MAERNDTPGYASDVELAAHWRVDRRSAPAIAKRLGIRRRRSGYSWFEIWNSENLAPPPPEQWDALRARMCDAHEVGRMISRSAKTAVRRSDTGWKGFPPALRLSPDLRRWRREEIAAWLDEDAPPFARLGAKAPVREATPSPAVDATRAAPAPSVAAALLAPNAPRSASRNDIRDPRPRADGQTGEERTQ